MKAQLSGEDSLATRHWRLSPGYLITTSYSVEESTHCRPTSALVVSLCDNILAAGGRTPISYLVGARDS